MAVSKHMKYILLVIVLAFIPGIVYAWDADFNVRGHFPVSVSGDTIAPGSYMVPYHGGITLLNRGAVSPLTNLTVTLQADSITNVDDPAYAQWTADSAHWVYPPNYTLSYKTIDWTTGLTPTVQLPVTFSRSLNQTVFSQDGYQRVDCTVTFWNMTDVDIIWGEFDSYKRDKVNVTILNSTFLTDLPVNSVYLQNNKQFQFELGNNSQVIVGYPYSFSIVLKIDRIDPAKTVIYKPKCGINLIKEISFRQPAGANQTVTIPVPELPPNVHQASASLNVSVNWGYWTTSQRSAILLENSSYDQGIVLNNRSRIGVVRNNNTWLLDASGNGAYGAGDLAYSFGKAGDVHVTGDWNSNGKTEIGVVRNNNTWLLDTSGNGAYGAGDSAYVFGKAGDVYVTGDWNADGKTEIGVVRNSNTWLLDNSGDGVYGSGDLTYSFGKAGDVFVTGDWNNDNRTEIGVVRNGNTWLLDTTGNWAFGTGDLAYVFGKTGDAYVTGDWNNDNRTEIGVVRNNNTWLLDNSGNGLFGAGDYAFTFGRIGDKYVIGKWS